MRALATIRVVDKLIPIEGADAIMLAKIDGWQCVVKKEEFKEGDRCVYFEIDSLIPMSPYVEHLRERSFKRLPHLNAEGIRVKTIKLRGQISQGLALPLSMLPTPKDNGGNSYPAELFYTEIGQDVTDILGVVKYELPIPSELSGRARGNFPGFLFKTAQERCQNLGYKIFTENKESRYEETMKLDGTSFTAYVRDGVAGVCSRVWDLDLSDPDNADNGYVKLFIESGLRDVMLSFGKNFAIQGELMGPGVMPGLKNRENLKAPKLFIFDVFDIDTGSYLAPDHRTEIVTALWVNGVKKDMVDHVPILNTNVTLAELGINNLDELIKSADGPSIYHAVREGKVYKRMDGQFSFKVISNKFLLKEED